MSTLADVATPVRRPRWISLAETTLVFFVFFLHGAWPAPDVNESHYLSKAKHFWNPDWVPHDFFLESADAHALFYWTVGWLTLFLPLAAVAWIGRLATWWLMAWTWRRLSFAVVPHRWYAVLSAALFICLQEETHMAGEWIVGGVEAKGFAYVLVFAGLEAFVRNRWNWALVLFGAASAFHVLVGGWCIVALGFAWFWVGKNRPPLVSLWPGLVVGFLLSLFGLIPGLALNANVPAEVAQQANQIYVFERLPHHLVPQGFEASLILKHLLLMLAWLILCLATPHDERQRRLRAVVIGSMVLCLTGTLLSAATSFQPALNAALMRYYWFRLGDVLVPAGVAIVGCAYIVHALRRRPTWGYLWLGVAVTIGATHLSGYAVRRMLPDVPRGDRPGRTGSYDDWRDVTAWIAANTPRDARFLTPRSNQTFKWYASRAEVVTWKDVPQDAPGLVEWWDRMNTVWATGNPKRKWRDTLAEHDVATLRQLGAKYDADYLVTAAEPRLALNPIYQNNCFAVYRLPP